MCFSTGYYDHSNLELTTYNLLFNTSQLALTLLIRNVTGYTFCSNNLVQVQIHMSSFFTPQVPKQFQDYVLPVWK